MSDPSEHVIIPYARFVEGQDRRRRITAALEVPPPTTDADVPPGPQEPPLHQATGWKQT